MESLGPSPANTRSAAGLNRIKIACLHCRQTKKKCDGAKPNCALCRKNKIVCKYEAPRSARANRSSLSPSNRTTSVPTNPKVSVIQTSNSGIEFLHTISSALNPWSAGNVGIYAWNLGLRLGPPSKTVAPPDLSLYSELVKVFFEAWHPVHSFLKPAAFMRVLDNKIQLGLLGELDVVLYGMCGIGALFSGQDEQPFTEAARIILNDCLDLEDCNIERLVGWLLRVHYLRIVKGPQASWIASATLANLMDASQLWRAENDHGWVDLDQLFWQIRLQNIWISWEYGREMVHLRGIRPLAEEYHQPNSNNIMFLLCLSERLYAGSEVTGAELSEALSEVATFNSNIPRLLMSRTILGFAIFRRIRALNASPKQITRILNIGRDGITAVFEILERPYPWPHMLYLPFQFLCLTLSINTAESLGYVPKIIHCLEAVSQTFDTEASRHVLNQAYFLVRAITISKVGEFATLNGSLPGEFRLQYEMDMNEAPPGVTTQGMDFTLQTSLPSTENLPLDALSDFFDHFR